MMTMKKRLLFFGSLAMLLCYCEVQDPETYAGYDSHIQNDLDVEQMLPWLSNWNRWGGNDELGTINFITPELMTSAAKLIKSGVVFSLARESSISTSGEVAESAYTMKKGLYGSRDYVGAIWHGFEITHLDGLSHVFADTSRLFNGYKTNNLLDTGAQKLGMETIARQGIVGRGVLIDAGRYISDLKVGDAILPSQLELVLKRQNIELMPGDILFIRTGFGRKNTRERRSGLHPSCLIMIRDKQIALLGSDGDNDAHPIVGFKRWSSAFHTVGIPYLGLPLIDNADLEALSEHCHKVNRYTFFVSISPWKLKGTTSSPINPLAIF